MATFVFKSINACSLAEAGSMVRLVSLKTGFRNLKVITPSFNESIIPNISIIENKTINTRLIEIPPYILCLIRKE